MPIGRSCFTERRDDVNVIGSGGFALEIILRRFAFVLAVLGVGCSVAAEMPVTETLKFTPAADSRGYIDVWQLRRDVAAVEALFATDDTDTCYAEGDPDERPPSARELKRQAAQQQACVTRIHRRYAQYHKAFAALNQAWGPILSAAVAKGDAVAEVILRQCNTTPVLDRSRFESTCDEDPARRGTAFRQLKNIGFAPAFAAEDSRSAAAAVPGVRPSRSAEQKRVLDLFRQGILGVDVMSANHGGNAPKDEAELQEIRRSMVIEAVLQEAPRAFTVSSGWPSAGWKTEGFAGLRLNRQPLTPGYLTWGRMRYYGGAAHPWTGPHYWRGGAMEAYLPDHRVVLVGGKDDGEFLRLLHEVLAAAQANIDRYLAQDARWGVFLLHRIGHHEWEPEGMASSTGKLDAAWLGQWELQRSFEDWQAVDSGGQVTASVFQDGEATRIAFRSDGAARPPVEDGQGCTLRYSGGSTYLPAKGSHATTGTETALGYLPGISRYSAFADGPVAPFEPLDPKKRYRQVLVQCPEGEWEDNNRVRFLLLANDTLLEFAREPGQGKPVIVRHFRRVGPQVAVADALGAKQAASATKATPDPAAQLDSIDKLASRAEDAAQKQRTADIGDLIASLHQLRNESLHYSPGRFPDNLQEILRRPGNIDALVAAYRGDRQDDLFRFNIITILSLKLRDGKLSEAEREAAAQGLQDASSDAFPWVRAEVAWGLRFSGDGKYKQTAAALAADSDKNVREEARTTVNILEKR